MSSYRSQILTYATAYADASESLLMAALAHTNQAFEIHATDFSLDHWRLLSTDDGWSLIRPNGEIAYRALGASGRRRCLELARDLGVLAVYS